MWNFILTEVCDWNCEYCVFPEIREPQHATKLSIESHIDYIKEIMDLTDPGLQNLMVQGGEVGFVPEDVLVHLFERTQRIIDVSTNGEFLRKGYHKHPKMRPWIKRVMLHIGEPIDDYKLELDYSLEDDDIFIDTGIVDVNMDPVKVKLFIQRNQDIRFDFVDYEHPVFDNPCRVNGFIYKDLYDAIEDLPNVTQFAKDRLLKRFLRHKDTDMKKQQEICRTLHPAVFIDFIHEEIPVCVRNCNFVSLPLTKDNLKKAISDISPFDYSNYTCDSCFRICQNGGVHMGQIQNRIRLKKKLL